MDPLTQAQDIDDQTLFSAFDRKVVLTANQDVHGPVTEVPPIYSLVRAWVRNGCAGHVSGQPVVRSLDLPAPAPRDPASDEVVWVPDCFSTAYLMDQDDPQNVAASYKAAWLAAQSRYAEHAAKRRTRYAVRHSKLLQVALAEQAALAQRGGPPQSAAAAFLRMPDTASLQLPQHSGSLSGSAPGLIHGPRSAAVPLHPVRADVALGDGARHRSSALACAAQPAQHIHLPGPLFARTQQVHDTASEHVSAVSAPVAAPLQPSALPGASHVRAASAGPAPLATAQPVPSHGSEPPPLHHLGGDATAEASAGLRLGGDTSLPSTPTAKRPRLPSDGPQLSPGLSPGLIASHLLPPGLSTPPNAFIMKARAGIDDSPAMVPYQQMHEAGESGFGGHPSALQ